MATTTISKAPVAPSQEEISRRAHAIWLAEGRPEGRALEHWQRAEKELYFQAASSPTPTAQKPVEMKPATNRFQIRMSPRKAGAAGQI